MCACACVCVCVCVCMCVSVCVCVCLCVWAYMSNTSCPLSYTYCVLHSQENEAITLKIKLKEEGLLRKKAEEEQRRIAGELMEVQRRKIGLKIPKFIVVYFNFLSSRWRRNGQRVIQNLIPYSRK